MDHEETIAAGSVDGSVDGSVESAVDGDGDEHVELVDELLIEEISIDGMCGVY